MREDRCAVFVGDDRLESATIESGYPDMRSHIEDKT